MSHEFDAIQGQRADVAAAVDGLASMRHLVQKFASTLHETEALHHHALRVEAWMREDLNNKRAKLDAMLSAAELKAKTP